MSTVSREMMFYFCEPYFHALNRWMGYDSSDLLHNRLQLISCVIEILNSRPDPSIIYDIEEEDSSVPLLSAIEPSAGTSFREGHDLAAFRAAAMLVSPAVFQVGGLYFQKHLLRSLSMYHGNSVTDGNFLQSSTIQTMANIFRLSRDCGFARVLMRTVDQFGAVETKYMPLGNLNQDTQKLFDSLLINMAEVQATLALRRAPDSSRPATPAVEASMECTPLRTAGTSSESTATVTDTDIATNRTNINMIEESPQEGGTEAETDSVFGVGTSRIYRPSESIAECSSVLGTESSDAIPSATKLPYDEIPMASSMSMSVERSGHGAGVDIINGGIEGGVLRNGEGGWQETEGEGAGDVRSNVGALAAVSVSVPAAAVAVAGADGVKTADLTDKNNSNSSSSSSSSSSNNNTTGSVQGKAHLKSATKKTAAAAVGTWRAVDGDSEHGMDIDDDEEEEEEEGDDVESSPECVKVPSNIVILSADQVIQMTDIIPDAKTDDKKSASTSGEKNSAKSENNENKSKIEMNEKTVKSKSNTNSTVNSLEKIGKGNVSETEIGTEQPESESEKTKKIALKKRKRSLTELENDSTSEWNSREENDVNNDKNSAGVGKSGSVGVVSTTSSSSVSTASARTSSRLSDTHPKKSGGDNGGEKGGESGAGEDINVGKKRVRSAVEQIENKIKGNKKDEGQTAVQNDTKKLKKSPEKSPERFSTRKGKETKSKEEEE